MPELKADIYSSRRVERLLAWKRYLYLTPSIKDSWRGNGFGIQKY